MISFNKWLRLKSEAFADRVYLINESRSVTYRDNISSVQALISQLYGRLSQGRHVVYLGGSSIEAYQLYFSIIALQAVWVPINPRLEQNTISQLIHQLDPSLVIYEEESLKKWGAYAFPCPCINLAHLFKGNSGMLNMDTLEEKSTNGIISAYLTSGSTGLPKPVLHSWYATLHHADTTVKRYRFAPDSRLFNPRQGKVALLHLPERVQLACSL